MALNVGLSVRLRQILTDRDCPAGVIEKLRELQVVEVEEFAGLSAHVHDMGEFFSLLKPDGATPEARFRTKMIIRRIWSECRDAATNLAPKKKDELRPGGRKPPLVPRTWATHPTHQETQIRNIV